MAVLVFIGGRAHLTSPCTPMGLLAVAKILIPGALRSR